MKLPEITVNKQQCIRCFNFLKAHGKSNVAEIITGANVMDPRSAIRHLRNAGVEIFDEWRVCPEGRYKVYWLAPEWMF